MIKEVVVFTIDTGADRVSARLSTDISGHFPPSLEGECPVSGVRDKRIYAYQICN